MNHPSAIRSRGGLLITIGGPRGELDSHCCVNHTVTNPIARTFNRFAHSPNQICLTNRRWSKANALCRSPVEFASN